MKAKKETPQGREEITELILDSIADGVFTIDQGMRITTFNKAAEQITGYARREVVGQFCHDIFKADICFKMCPLKHTARTLESIVNMEVNILNRQNQEVPISISTSILKNHKGEVVGGVDLELFGVGQISGGGLDVGNVGPMTGLRHGEAAQ